MSEKITKTALLAFGAIPIKSLIEDEWAFEIPGPDYVFIEIYEAGNVYIRKQIFNMGNACVPVYRHPKTITELKALCRFFGITLKSKKVVKR